MHIFITGAPKVGKSTLLKQIVAQQPAAQGCLVEALYDSGHQRTGFVIRYFPHRRETILASRLESNLENSLKKYSDHRVGKYSVNLKGIEEEMIPFLYTLEATLEANLIIFDEIGRMQHQSLLFLPALDQLLKTQNTLVATILEDDEPWARPYKNNPESFYVHITKDTREIWFEIVTLMLHHRHTFDTLTKEQQRKVVILFQKYAADQAFPSIQKLFKKALNYVARARYKDCTVLGEHGEYSINKNPEKNNPECSCTFFKKHHKDCSHIQTLKIGGTIEC